MEALALLLSWVALICAGMVNKKSGEAMDRLKPGAENPGANSAAGDDPPEAATGGR
jgi:hypothetical protein